MDTDLQFRPRFPLECGLDHLIVGDLKDENPDLRWQMAGFSSYEHGERKP
jgi:hypothetical protein